jgi:succinate dehydrogenase / fumarate reductase iron-sulfur subunit
MSGSDDTIELRVLRQMGPSERHSRHWQRFRVALTPRTTVAGALLAIERDPRTVDGERVAPVVWEASCRPRACASCALNVDGRVRLACSSLLAELSPKRKPLSLTPLQRFPLVRDLLVDRSAMGKAARRMRAYNASPTRPATSQARAAQQLALSRCTSCGACVEACPETQLEGAFLGAAAIAGNELSARLATSHDDASEVDAALLHHGGIAGCEGSLNCAAVCPEALPLDDAIGHAARRATRHWLRRP